MHFPWSVHAALYRCFKHISDCYLARTLFENYSKCRIFKNSSKCNIFGISNEPLSAQNENVARFTCNLNETFSVIFKHCVLVATWNFINFGTEHNSKHKMASKKSKIWCVLCNDLFEVLEVQFPTFHNFWKSLKYVAFEFSILAFSINFCPI